MGTLSKRDKRGVRANKKQDAQVESLYTICITFKLGLHILSCMNDARKIKDLKIFVHLSTLIGGVHNWVVSSSAYLIGILVVTAHLSIKTCLLDRAKSYRNQYYINNTEKLMIMYMRSVFPLFHISKT